MLRIITAEERLAAPQKIGLLVLGPSGVGKTTLVRTMNPATTLFLDVGEAGTLAIQDWPGRVVKVRDEATRMGCHPWILCMAIACWIGGPDPADANGFYSQAMYDWCLLNLGGADILTPYTDVFVDSISEAARWCFNWCQSQPRAFSEKSGKPDIRGAYGLLGEVMVRWLKHLQHAPKSMIIVGILDHHKSDTGMMTWEPQIEGSKTGRELPGIFDQVVTLQVFPDQAGNYFRAFVTKMENPLKYPAKDRSGCLEMYEPPDLSNLLAKIRSKKRTDKTLMLSMPMTPTNPNAPVVQA